MKKVIKVFTIVLLTIIGLFIIATLWLLSRGFSETINLVHKDSAEFYEDYNFSESKISKYGIDDVVFLPYMTQNPYQTYDPEYDTYCLRLAVHRQKGNNSKVVVNNVSIEAIQDVEFNKVFNTVNQTIQFTEDEDYQNLPTSLTVLVDNINNYDMKLTEKSQVEVTLNVSVEEDGKETTKDITYIFETNRHNIYFSNQY